MGFLAELWIPILVSSVAVFIAAFIAWTILPHHKPDYGKLPNEESFLESLKAANPPPGQYMFPYCEGKEMKDPGFKQRYEASPKGWLVLWPGMPNMGKNMLLTFIFYLVVGVFVAYLAHAALAENPSPPYLDVFRITGTAAIMAYCFGFIPHAIWFGRTFRSVAMDVIDGVVYALLTAGFFGWLWPRAGEVMESMPTIG